MKTGGEAGVKGATVLLTGPFLAALIHREPRGPGGIKWDGKTFTLSSNDNIRYFNSEHRRKCRIGIRSGILARR